MKTHRPKKSQHRGFKTRVGIVGEDRPDFYERVVVKCSTGIVGDPDPHEPLVVKVSVRSA